MATSSRRGAACLLSSASSASEEGTPSPATSLSPAPVHHTPACVNNTPVGVKDTPVGVNDTLLSDHLRAKREEFGRFSFTRRSRPESGLDCSTCVDSLDSGMTQKCAAVPRRARI